MNGTTGAVHADVTGNVMYQSATGDYRGTININSSLPSTPLTVAVLVGNYLSGGVENHTITPTTTNTIPTITLTAGDVNADDVIDIEDYNELISCYQQQAAKQACIGASPLVYDLNDDGIYDISDLNLFLRETKGN